ASRAARHAAQATSLLHDLAEADLAQIADAKGDTLPVEPALALGQARAENLLRYWLAGRGLPIPDTRRLDSLLKQAAEAADDKAPQVTWPGAEARCWRGRLYAFEPMGPRPPLPTRWHGEPLALKGLGELRAVPAETGLRADIFAAGVQIHWRSGGERIQPAGQRHHRELKDLLREAGVVPWMRDRVPILWFEGEVAAVADLWIASKFAAQPDSPAMHIEWDNASDAISPPA
ncbi:MAG TPA: tRNA lysidine(34) synthetase TilS, partial [Gammaproteobacteria bacterium]|nr:tRNA lysidine(34) synthetase TilS [Gammaproteobacteria bacterium]